LGEKDLTEHAGEREELHPIVFLLLKIWDPSPARFLEALNNVIAHLSDGGDRADGRRLIG
jgi:hypothetical protein